MSLSDFLKTVLPSGNKADEVSKSITFKSGTVQHSLPFNEVKGQSIQQVLERVAPFLGIDVSSVEIVYKLFKVEDRAEPGTFSLESERITAEYIIDDDDKDNETAFNLDQAYGEKGKN
jgi:hypothetical protein